jgi:drug/metabolite transporter (DMT)-like permease
MRRGSAVNIFAFLRSPYVSAILCLIIVSANAVMVRGVAFDVPPMALIFWRNVIGVAVLVAVAWPHLRVELPVIRSHWPMLLLCGFLHVVLGNGMNVLGLHSTTVINASLMSAFLPAVTVSFALMLGFDRVRRVQVAGIALSALGVMILIGRGQLSTFINLDFGRGDLLILVSVISFSLYNAIVREAAPGIHVLSLTACVCASGLICVTPFFLWENFTGETARFEANLIIAASYMGFFGTFLAMILWNHAVRIIGPARTGPLNNLGPVFGIAQGMIFLRERLEPYHLAGIVVIGAGIYLATFIGRRRRQRIPTHE